MFASKDVFLAAPSGGYTISRSVRLRSSASAYFNRTPASAGNRTTWTWSGWVKQSTISAQYALFCAQDAAGSNASVYTIIQFNSSSLTVFRWNGSSYDFILQTSAVYRDPSAWFYVCVSVDTTQATSTNRAKIYVNGVETPYSTATYPSQNFQADVNAATRHAVAAQVRVSPNNFTQFFDGYLTEINFIDGQALTPSSFGEYNTITGVWQPKKYSGTYGTNGFYLNFSDNSNNTAATIGKDYSGNGNNWTPNNISVTTGSTYDSMLDVPTPYADGGNGRGNYAVLNTLQKTTQSGTVSDGNLAYTANGANANQANASMVMATGKWYWEVVYSTIASGYPICGIQSGVGLTYSNGSIGYPGVDASGWGVDPSGRIYTSNTLQATYTAISAGDVVMFAYDADTGKFWTGKNGTWFNSGAPASGTGQVATASFYANGAFPSVSGYASSVATANFGQRPFAYTPPTGFVALNTQNLPTPTILNGANYMAATLYTGNGTTTQSISNAVNGVSFRPDFVWNKTRSNADDHRLVDVVRGGGTDLSSSVLYSNLTNAQDNASGYLTQASNGFNLGVAATPLNMSGRTYVAWQWKAGDTTSSNTSGSITSTVSVNATAGFSVVTYTGTGANATVGHGLGVAPSMMIFKQRSSSGINWIVWHSALSNVQYLNLNTTGAVATAGALWNSSFPTSSVVNIGTDVGTNANGVTYVGYLFAQIAGYSAFGSYTGNGSTDGPFVFLGFRPRFVMMKNYSSAGDDWMLFDSSRNTYNVTDLNLRPNTSGAESSQSANYIDFLSNGFKIRGTSAGSINASQNYIYAAFAENPFKNSLAR